MKKVNLSDRLPKVKVPQKARIPSVWEEGTLEKLLSSIDRGNPAGKRDYAILLLASLLGMRSIDIRKIQFSNIDWEKRSIDIIQSKSKRSVSYPLLTSVGWAIIDYIKHGRPECECPEVFITQRAPFRPLAAAASFDDIIKKYMKLAHIVVPKEHKYGIHSLRHTYATSLMEKHIPIEDIAQLMGHVSPNTTAIYLKSSLGLLSECPLTLDEE
jgi:integrase